MNDKTLSGNKFPMVEQTRKHARSNGISTVILGLSGGSDSVTLLSVLLDAGICVKAIHCNFNLRGEESLRDRKFVEELCRKKNVALKIFDLDVDAYRKTRKKTSVEMACRDLRFDIFRKEMILSDAQRICVAHNADDNIETFFINMLRGSGTRGLKGMDGDNGEIWRPLLGFHKKEICRYLNERNLEYVTDSTNLESEYRRNIIRNEIIPLFKNEWKGFDKAMDSTIKNISSENKVVEEEIEKIIAEHPEGIPVKTILGFPAPELLVKRFIDPAGPYPATPVEIISALKAEKPHAPLWKLKRGTVTVRKHLLKCETELSETNT